MLRQRDDIRNRMSKPNIKRPDFSRIRTQSGENADTRRVANGELTIGAIKSNTCIRQGIDIRRMDLIDSVTSQLSPKIINRDEQNIRFFCGEN